MKINVEQARGFVANLALPPPPRAGGMLSAEELAPMFEAGQKQALVVASDAVAFTPGVTAQQREDLTHVLLLAQLRADREVQDREDAQAWYRNYQDTLLHLGFAVQDLETSKYTYSGEAVTVHEGILEVAAVLLGGAPTALALITTTLKSLKTEGPWLTLFEKQSRSGKVAKFSFALARPAPGGGFEVDMAAFSLVATTQLTQVLLFKLNTTNAKLHCSHCTAASSQAVLDATRDVVKQKIAAYVAAYIRALPI